MDLNHRPWGYEPPALPAELRGHAEERGNEADSLDRGIERLKDSDWTDSTLLPTPPGRGAAHGFAGPSLCNAASPTVRISKRQNAQHARPLQSAAVRHPSLQSRRPLPGGEKDEGVFASTALPAGTGGGLNWSRQSASNERPAAYKAAALPTELRRHSGGRHDYSGPRWMVSGFSAGRLPDGPPEPGTGFEPAAWPHSRFSGAWEIRDAAEP